MVGAMNTALVISQMPGSKEMIRSDMVAAKVLQNAIKEGRGEEVLSPRTSDARSKGAAAADSGRCIQSRINPRENRRYDESSGRFESSF